jgi:hypothetical protein
VAEDIFSAVRYGEVGIGQLIITGKTSSDSNTGHMHFKSITPLDSAAAQL